MLEIRSHENKIQIVTNKENARKIIKHFQVQRPGANYDPRVRSGRDDGYHKFYKISLIKNDLILIELEQGFLNKVNKLLKQNLEISEEYSRKEILDFLKREIPNLPFKPRKYQLEMVIGMLQNQRHLGVVATGGGKSLIFYLVVKFLYEKNKKTILIVPTINLVQQMYNDLIDYNAPKEFLDNIQLLGGEYSNKNLQKRIVISTWQSLSNVKKLIINTYDCLYVDEVHIAKALTINTLLKLNVPKKIGMTGSLPIVEIDAMKLEEIFGEPVFYAKAKDLIELGLLTKTVIIALFLNYPRKMTRSSWKYQEETKFIKENPERIKYTIDLLKKIASKGISVGTFSTTKFGETIYKNLTGINPKRIKNDFNKQKELNTFFISGSTKSSVREEIRQYLNSLESKNEILIAQTKVIDTGSNYPKMKNFVFLEAPGKSFTKILQSMGRVMRLHKEKGKEVYIWDIVDCFDYARENYSLRHFWERLKYYENEGHEIIEKEINLN